MNDDTTDILIFCKLNHSTGIWMVSLAEPNIPSPSDFGWNLEDDKWSLLWITIPVASESTHELIKCRCTGDCYDCKCGKANLDCQLLCRCPCPK